VCEDCVVDFLCEDLPQHGLVLVPPGSGDYEGFLADILSRVNAPVDGSPPYPEMLRPRVVEEDRSTSAILLNHSAKTIVGLQAVWRFEQDGGHGYRHSIGMLSPQILLLSHPNESARKLHAYWHTIFPGSKRYLGRSGMVGDNTDVRLPSDEEKWRGGMGGGGGRGGSSRSRPILRVTLVLDGVFFSDGEFVGPDEARMFDRTAADAEAHQIVARIAKEGYDRGLAPAEILTDVEKTTGVAPDRPPIPWALRNEALTRDDFLTAALQSVAHHLGMRRRFPQAGNEEQMVSMIIGWNNMAPPNFRKA
jgi:hypothetical protein